ncbi:MAG: hypothetical protein ACREDT_06295 [Methylocella sp.]
MDALVFGKARMAARTLLARLGRVWMWPGIPLTEKRGAACVPIAADAARFWITRLHGPEAINTYVLHYLGAAAWKLNEGDEAGAQQALDASGLSMLSTDGLELMRRVAASLGIAPLDLPWAEGPRLWRAEDIAAHLPLFKGFAPAVDLLAKAGVWDESKHPRWPAGSEDHQGGRFNFGEGGAVNDGPTVDGQSADKKPSEQGSPPLGVPPEIPKVDPIAQTLRYAFAKLAARWLVRALVGAEFGPAGEFVVALEAAAETAAWLYDKYPFIKAYLDGPKTLEELQSAVGTPRTGTDVHHIVEQTPAARDERIPDALIDGPDNLVRIPTLKHWEITGWFMRGHNDAYGGVSPRAYLEGNSWEERRRVGLDALKIFGVLEP